LSNTYSSRSTIFLIMKNQLQKVKIDEVKKIKGFYFIIFLA